MYLSANLGDVTGTLAVANGGTGQTSVAAARNAMGLGNTSGAVPVANGGTGATSGAGAIYNITNPATALASSGLAVGDYLPILDTSASTGKKVTLANFATFMGSQISSSYSYIIVTAPSGTTVTIKNSSSTTVGTHTATGSPIATAVTSTGTYTVSGTKSGSTKSATVSITTTGQSVSTTLEFGWSGSTTVGDTITWCGVQWIVVHNDTSNKRIYICKKTAYGTTTTQFNPSAGSTTNNMCRYSGSTLATLANTYASSLSSNAEYSYAVDVTIHGVTAKIWAPAHGMVGSGVPSPYNDTDGTNNHQGSSGPYSTGSAYTTFSYFNYAYNTNQTARICYNDSGTAVVWWTATAYGYYSVWLVYTNGSANSNNSPFGSYWFRPFACLQY